MKVCYKKQLKGKELHIDNWRNYKQELRAAESTRPHQILS